MQPDTIMDSYLSTLNDKQLEAVQSECQHLLILAGAGTGKTRVLTTRITHLLRNGIQPYQVLAVTFTNRAAAEMRERLLHDSPQAQSVWLGTFHSICVRILRRHAEAVGLNSQFTILDWDDQLRLIKDIMKAHGLDEKRYAPKVALNNISLLKDRGVSALKIDSTTSSGGQPIPTWLKNVYKTYHERLQNLNAVDFGDLLLHVIHIFNTFPDILAQYHHQFKHILIDEYQDTNVAQYLWLRLLAQGGAHVCCVGDDDQSIYGWRGAEVDNILRFEKDFPGAHVIRLEQNYRSTPHILGAASALIKNNEGRLGKTLWTESDKGEKVDVICLRDNKEEAVYVGGCIEKLFRQGYPLNETSILVRASYQTREFEERLMTFGIPYKVVGGPRFYERMEIRDALAYLRVIHNTGDSLAFERILNTPKRGLGASTLNVLHVVSRSQQISLFDAACEVLETDELRPQARTALSKFTADIQRWRSEAQQPPAELAKIVLDESGYTAFWKAEKSPDAASRLENLKELVKALEEFDTLEGFLEHVSLVMESISSTEISQCTIMTLHSAKGLEFGTVFLAGWEEGLFPHQRALEDGGEMAIEEERRLAYVGLTRAKEKAVITYVAVRRVFYNTQHNLPSRFLSELPEAHVMYHNRAQRYYPQPAQTTPRLSSFQEFDFNQESMGGLQKGSFVSHKKFGNGVVRKIEGDRVDVEFQQFGLRKVLASFLIY